MLAYVVQTSSFQIGASVGVVLEFKCMNITSAALLEQELRIRLEAVMRLVGGIPGDMAYRQDIEGETLDEIFKEILSPGIRSE